MDITRFAMKLHILLSEYPLRLDKTDVGGWSEVHCKKYITPDI